MWSLKGKLILSTGDNAVMDANYHITPATGSSDQLERRCWNENYVPAEAGPPGPRLSSPGERERKAVIARRVGESMSFSLCSVSNSLSHTTLSIKWEVRVFANGPGDLGSIPGQVIPKTQKMVLDAPLLNTSHYKVRIKGKVDKSRE